MLFRCVSFHIYLKEQTRIFPCCPNHSFCCLTDHQFRFYYNFLSWRLRILYLLQKYLHCLCPHFVQRLTDGCQLFQFFLHAPGLIIIKPYNLDILRNPDTCLLKSYHASKGCVVCSEVYGIRQLLPAVPAKPGPDGVIPLIDTKLLALHNRRVL